MNLNRYTVLPSLEAPGPNPPPSATVVPIEEYAGLLPAAGSPLACQVLLIPKNTFPLSASQAH